MALSRSFWDFGQLHQLDEQKKEQKSGQKKSSNASKQGKFGSFRVYFVHIFALYVGVGVSKRIPNKMRKLRPKFRPRRI